MLENFKDEISFVLASLRVSHNRLFRTKFSSRHPWDRRPTNNTEPRICNQATAVVKRGEEEEEEESPPSENSGSQVDDMGEPRRARESGSSVKSPSSAVVRLNKCTRKYLIQVRVGRSDVHELFHFCALKLRFFPHKKHHTDVC